MQRKMIIEDLLQDIHAMRHKLMVGYSSKHHEDITPSQSVVLRFVADNQETPIKNIANVLHITSSAATQLVDALVDKGYIIREQSATDRRVSKLSLSPEAKKLLKTFTEQRINKMMKIFEVLTDKELAQFVTLQKKVAASISNASCDQSPYEKTKK